MAILVAQMETQKIIIMILKIKNTHRYMHYLSANPIWNLKKSSIYSVSQKYLYYSKH